MHSRPVGKPVRAQSLGGVVRDLGCELDAFDAKPRIGIEQGSQVHPGPAADVERALGPRLLDGPAQERDDELRGREGHLGDRACVPLQIVAPLLRRCAEQVGQLCIRAQLVLEHRAVVRGEQRVAPR